MLVSPLCRRMAAFRAEHERPTRARKALRCTCGQAVELIPRRAQLRPRGMAPRVPVGTVPAVVVRAPTPQSLPRGDLAQKLPCGDFAHRPRLSLPVPVEALDTPPHPRLLFATSSLPKFLEDRRRSRVPTATAPGACKRNLYLICQRHGLARQDEAYLCWP